ncbi:Os10g0371700 [Oryza sativa Japonica Group]|uniref:Os10g0371700 protein n=4 Tax=Oryza TaxID=4527 RepID=Q8H7J9_ORYSJ|nr:Hypothetical protein [Oryza sativa Japonica Group]AAP53394.1 hypothetical protein LOC_Os10g22660 [Oryza sativa Japonica Group]EEE63924.1 hypothetical protein OsJ_18749 [Oryza sativa Japonica Group]BAT10571.1 Os10g0371700 [Oryza sativa Japonica Group]
MNSRPSSSTEYECGLCQGKKNNVFEENHAMLANKVEAGGAYRHTPNAWRFAYQPPSLQVTGDQPATSTAPQPEKQITIKDDNDDDHHINNVNIALNSYNYNMANESIFNSGLLHPNTQDYISGCKDLWYGPYEDDEKKDWLSSFELLVDELWKNK